MLRHRKNKGVFCVGWDGVGCRTRVYVCVGVTDIARRYLNGGTTVDSPKSPNTTLTHAYFCT